MRGALWVCLMVLLASIAVAAPRVMRSGPALPRATVLSAAGKPVAISASNPLANFQQTMAALQAAPNLNGCFLHIDGVTGGCSIPAYQGWMEVLSYSELTTATWLITHDAFMETGLNINPLVITKRTDAASPQLASALTSAKQFTSAQLDLLGPGYAMTIFVKGNVRVASIHSASDGAGQTAEEVTLTFASIEVDAHTRRADGSLGGLVSSSLKSGCSGASGELSHIEQALAANPRLQGCFLDVGRQGECAVEGYRGWSAALSYSQTTAATWFSQPTQADGTAPALNPLVVTKRPDAATPRLFYCCANRLSIPGVTLNVLKGGGMMSIHLHRAGLSRIRWAFDDQGQPIEELTFLADAIDLAYRSRDAHGSLGSVVWSHWQVQ